MISIRNLSKQYDGTPIFDHTSFSFPNRGLICLFGPSGCGKSTLLNLLAGFDRDYTGEISVHGTPLSELNETQLCAYRREQIGFVFQNYHLISGYTALENILLASDAMGTDPTESRQRAQQLLENLGLAEKADQPIETLSGGQKQRVAIARALINQPSIILADEPTGALDRKNSSEIMELFQQLSKSRLVLFITHDPKCAGYADQIVTIADGALCSETEPVETPAPAASIQTAAPKISMLKRAVKNFMLRLPRYTAIALAMSLGVLCFTLSLSSGNLIKQSIADFEAKNTAYHNGYIPVEDNADSLYTLLSQDQRLEAVYLQYVLSQVSVTVGDQTVEMPEKYPMAKAKQQLSYGVMPRRGAAELALSPSLAAKFDKQIQNLVGKSAEVCYNGQRFSVTISGIFNAPYDDFFISSDLEQQFYEAQQGPAYSITYDVREFEDIVPVSVQLAEQQLSSQNAAAEVAAFQSTFRQLNRLFLTVSMLIFAVGLLISGILLMKQQRTRAHELALLSALGYRKGNIQAMVAFETLLLALGAALLTLGLTGTAILAGTAAGFPLILTLPQVLTALCLTLVLSLAIGFLSSFKVLRTDPAIALRS